MRASKPCAARVAKPSAVGWPEVVSLGLISSRFGNGVAFFSSITAHDESRSENVKQSGKKNGCLIDMIFSLVSLGEEKFWFNFLV